MKKNKQNIAIIGLGYVGLPLAVEFGKKFKTVGFDINKTRVDQLKSGTDITLEVDDKNLKKAENLSYTSDTKEIARCNFYIITVPTPIDDAKRPNLDPIIKSTKIVAENLNDGDFVIYESTVFLAVLKKYVFLFWRKYLDYHLMITFFVIVLKELIQATKSILLQK